MTRRDCTARLEQQSTGWPLEDVSALDHAKAAFPLGSPETSLTRKLQDSQLSVLARDLLKKWQRYFGVKGTRKVIITLDESANASPSFLQLPLGDNALDQCELTERLTKNAENVSGDRLLAFAFHVIIYALPFLTIAQQKENVFWYWSYSRRSKNLLYLFRAVNMVFAYLCTNQIDKNIKSEKVFLIADEVADTADRLHVFFKLSGAEGDVEKVAHWIDCAYAITGVITAIGNMCEAIETDHDREKCLYAAKSSIIAFGPYGDVGKGIIDQEILEIGIRSKEKLLRRKVYVPEKIQFLFYDFVRDIVNLSEGFEYWAQWFEERMRGDVPFTENIKYSVNIPDKIGAKGVYAVNVYLSDKS